MDTGSNANGTAANHRTVHRAPGSILWKFNGADIRVASVRYRGLKPIVLLNKAGWKNSIAQGKKTPDWHQIGVLINIKSYTFHDLYLIQRAYAAGVPIVLDLCDNIFVDSYGSGKTLDPAHLFREMAAFANVVTVPTQALSDLVREHIGPSTKLVVIPDGCETPSDLEAMARLLPPQPTPYEFSLSTILAEGRRRAPRRLAGLLLRGFPLAISRLRFNAGTIANRLRAKFERRTKSLRRRPRLVWFGNHGADHASFGMLDLCTIRADLEQMAKRHGAELLVVSNNRAKYQNNIRPFGLKTRYAAWDPISIYDWVATADVVVLPNSRDPFSVCKSPNRAILALGMGVPVVATRTPGYDAFNECILFDGFSAHIDAYLSDRDLASSHVEMGKRAIANHFADEQIASLWSSVLVEVATGRRFAERTGKVAFFLALGGDVEVLEPLIRSCIGALPVTVMIDVALLEQSPHVWEAFSDLDPVLVLATDFGSIASELRKLRVFVTSSESNLAPHRTAHQITKLANRVGVKTLTVQHGLENIGITYTDRYQPIDKIEFAASHLLTWGDASTYHVEMTEANRSKCIPIGCPKRVSAPPMEARALQRFTRNVGIFENLHWKRYSDEYRTEFLAALGMAAKAMPDVGFVVRPHPAGVWLTQRYTGAVPVADNIIVLDPRDAEWRNVVARHLLTSLVGVITSPSTVAIDAALADKPVAVASFDLSLPMYEGLTRIRDRFEWLSFCELVVGSSPVAIQKLLDDQRRFTGRELVQGDPCRKFIGVAEFLMRGRA